jgi:hypothetical protein
MHILKNILPADPAELSKGLYVVIVHPARVPPHLILSWYGKLFSITVNGPRPNEDLGDLLSVFAARSWPLLFCKIKLPAVSNKEVLTSLNSVLEQHQRVEVGGATCLSPLKSFFNATYDLDTGSVNFIYDLIPFLEEKQLVEGYSSFHMAASEFGFKPYSKEDIDREIIRAQSRGTPPQNV